MTDDLQNIGKCIIISAPSGAGKTTIVHHLLHAGLGLAFSVSACSRQMRADEVDGRDYYFISLEDFQQRIANHEFIEWEEVYPGSLYGTLKEEINRIWSLGLHVVFDVDAFGALNLKKLYGEQSLSVFIMPPSLEILEERLRKRGTDSEENLQKRLSKALIEMDMKAHFDKVLVNEKLEDSLASAEKLVREFLAH